MTNPEKSFRQPEKPKDHEQQLRDLIASMTEIARWQSSLASNEIILLEDDEHEKIVKNATRYVEFEFTQFPTLMNLPVRVSGTGLFILADENGVEQGSERIYEGDEITGTISGVSAIPVPAVEWLHQSNGNQTSFTSEVIAPALILNAATLKADPLPGGGYESEADLTGFQVFVPFVYYLAVAPAES